MEWPLILAIIAIVVGVVTSIIVSAVALSIASENKTTSVTNAPADVGFVNRLDYKSRDEPNIYSGLQGWHHSPHSLHLS